MLKFRKHNENDQFLVEKWVAQDSEHSRTSDVLFWSPPKDPAKAHKGTDYLVVEDDVGVIGYLVLENCLRIHCQFPPAFETDRIRAAISEFIPTIKNQAQSQYKQLIFESVSMPLIWFLRKFGFRRSKNEIVCKLER
jgi:hypothetical protein